MRILVLGGDGMLGHRLLSQLGHRHTVRATLRRDSGSYAALGLFGDHNAYFGADLRDTARLGAIIADFRPDAIVNAAGIVKQRGEAADAIESIKINALAPHRIAALAAKHAARLIHISTDCVFSGRAGNYCEDEIPDPIDLYGRSKLLGEIPDQPHCLTIRTSIIGRELARKTGLLEWFLAAPSPVPGYTRAVFSGLTTIELSRVIETVLTDHPELAGIRHVSGEPIDKCRLLTLCRDALRADCEIVPDEAVIIDRSLDSSRFRAGTGYRPPSWEDMVSELAATFTRHKTIAGQA